MDIQDLNKKIDELTDRFNSLIERLNKTQIKAVVDFSDLEFSNYDEDFITEEENQSEDFDIMPK